MESNYDVDENENKQVFVLELLSEIKKQSKRWMIAFFIVLGLWAATIAGFIWYLNQYDFTSYSQDGDGNNYMNSEIEGNVHNGAEIPGEKEKEQE